jgi:hypothetical protein
MASGSSQSSSSSSTPWAAQQPYLRDIYRQARGLSDQPMEYYPGSTVAPQAGETTESQAMMADRARTGGGLYDAARGVTEAELRGDYLEGNPHRTAMFDQAAGDITRAYKTALAPGTDTGFASSGRYGSYGHRGQRDRDLGVLGQELSDLSGRIHYADYAKERGAQSDAARYAPQLAEAGYADAERLGEVGREKEGYYQQLLDDLIRRFEFGQNEPWQRLGQYSSLVGAPAMTSQASSGGWSFGIGCWVSAEYFDYWTPSWWATRNWIMDGWQTPAGRLFRAVYLKHGEAIAAAVRRSRLVKAALRPIFNWCRRKGLERALAEVGSD